MIARRDARALRVALAAVSVLSSSACNQATNTGHGPGTLSYTLTTAAVGIGGVDIPGKPPTCRRSCAYDDIAAGTVINLAAVPGQGWHFTGWSGGCSGTSLATAVTLTAAMTCTANFAPDTPVLLTIVVNGAGSGQVASQTYSLVSTYASTSVNLGLDDEIVLVETPRFPSTFSGWTGCDGISVAGECTVVMNGPRTIIATFSPPGGGGPTYHLLEVYVTGSGHVTNVSYGGRTCDSICGYTNASGATVSLLAEPDPYWAFGSWGPAGACTGTNPSINVVMDADKDCRATFVPIGPVQLSVGVTGTGTGTITGPRIDCGTDCDETYGTGQPVVLHASHSTISKIDGWTNCVPSSDLQSCTVTMDASKRVEVSISLLAHLVVQVTPQGRITSADPSIDCTSTCEAYYEGGKQVTLTATPLPGWHFDSWSGCPNPPNANTCTVTIGPAGYAYVSAQFVQDPVVGVQVVTSGSGTVTGSGLNCGSGGSACAITMPSGTVVTLTATADNGTYFDHWTGDCSGIGSPTRVTAGPGITCTAVFQPGAGPDRSRIVAGSGHSCAIKPDGAVRCWGTGAPLGNGLATGSNAPVTVSGIPGQGGLSAVALAAGGTHTCALLSDQTVRCWGSNGMGQLGDGTTGAALSPIAATGITSAVAIATGNMHTCAVLDDTTVRCWGDNRYGQLGNGSTSTSGEPLPVQVMRRASVPASGFTSVSAAVLVTCAQVVGSVDVQCWGTDAQGEFGNGQPSQQHFYADTANVLNMTAPVRMASGGTVGGTTCVVEANAGGVACWGLGSSGQLGNGASASSGVPVWATGILLATDVAVGSDHACARLTSGEVHCWGAGTVGQIGDNFPHATNVPQRVLLAGTRAEVVGSGPAANHTCVLADDGTAWCWGAANAGQLGDGTAGPGLYVPYPVKVQGF